MARDDSRDEGYVPPDPQDTPHALPTKPIQNHTQEELEQVIHQYKGSLTTIARALDCQYTDLVQIIYASPRLTDLCFAYRQELVDVAEAGLRAALDRGNLKAIIFTLKTLGKRRGYYEKMEHDYLDSNAPQQKNMDLTRLSDKQLAQLGELITAAHEHPEDPDDD